MSHSVLTNYRPHSQKDFVLIWPYWFTGHKTPSYLHRRILGKMSVSKYVFETKFVVAVVFHGHILMWLCSVVLGNWFNCMPDTFCLCAWKNRFWNLLFVLFALRFTIPDEKKHAIPLLMCYPTNKNASVIWSCMILIQYFW